MKRLIVSTSLAAQAAVCTTSAFAAGIAVQQGSPANSVYVIQERSPFHTHESTVTANTGRSSATEIVEIGPDPAPLSVTQVGAYNRAVVYQRGTMPNLDVRQSGGTDIARSQQHAMP